MWDDRIIPAHAGSTCRRDARTSRCGDHPRSRGEHGVAGEVDFPPVGSSPLTRGALDLGVQVHDSFRIIPAHAGSTSSLVLRGCRTRDHPRSRGEHAPKCRLKLTRHGSSPLTRGAPSPSAASAAAGRIIPAHAGSTASTASIRTWRTDHPRSRGEHPNLDLRAEHNDGSSPLTRGAPRRAQPWEPRQGIIPAHAGSTGLAICSVLG